MSEEKEVPHPGKVLRETCEKLGITAYRLAKGSRLDMKNCWELLQERRGFTPNSVLRISRFLATDPLYWMKLQTAWELEQEKQKIKSQLNNIRSYREWDAAEKQAGRQGLPDPENLSDAEKPPSRRGYKKRTPVQA